MALAHSLAPCILRPRQENTLTLEDRHSYRLIRDLFEHKEAIFGELKRQSSTLLSSGNSQRQRASSNANPAVSTDESSRREKMEARAKAIADARRDRSPAPTNRHRRDASTGGAAGRFPVVASPRPDGHVSRDSVGRSAPPKRASLEVPGSEHSSPTQSRTDRDSKHTPSHLQTPAAANGNISAEPSPDIYGVSSTFSGGGPGPHIPPPREDDSPVSDPTPPQSANQAAFGQNAQAGSVKRTAVGSRPGSVKEKALPNAPEGSAGVQLVDKPMDD